MDKTEMDKTEVETTEKVKTKKKEKSNKKEKTKVKKSFDFRLNFTKYIESIQSNWKALLFTAVAVIVFMAAITLAVFFAMVKSPEEVFVPNVVNKPLEEAVQELQVKKLYPNIQLRYSNSQSEKGLVLEQDPPGSSIVKAQRQINLVVSNGAVIDRVGNYIGQKFDDVKLSIQALMAGSAVPLINLPDVPNYRSDASEPGTILEQDPPPDTALTSPVKMSLIVSSGPGNETTRVPYIVGFSLNDTLLQMSRSKIVFNFTAASAEKMDPEKPGVVISQKLPTENENIPVYTSTDCVINIPDTAIDGILYGIYETQLPAYPFALKVSFDAIPPEGDAYNIVSFKHPGGKLTIPYAVPRLTVLVLTVQDQEIARFTVQ